MTNFKEMSLAEIEAANQYNYIGELARRLNVLTETTRELLLNSHKVIVVGDDDYLRCQTTDVQPEDIWYELNKITNGEK